MNRKAVQIAPLLITIAALLIALSSNRGGKDREYISEKRLAMGTVIEVSVEVTDLDSVPMIKEVFDEIDRIESLMGSSPESEASLISNAQDSAAVSAETRDVVAAAIEFARLSGGAFDITLGRLKKLWNFEEGGTVPVAEDIKAALSLIGTEKLTIDGELLRKTEPELRIDLSGIAKGYAVDRAVTLLRERGLDSASVNAGGDIAMVGDRSGRPWKIAIQHPRNPQEIIAVIPVIDRAVVTSGDYERFFESGGVRYHHILDPKTGYPARNCQSVTVVAPSAMVADALATAAFVLGPEKGIALLEDYTDAEGFIIDAAGGKRVTKGLSESIIWQ